MQITEHEKLICFLNGFLTYALGHSQEQTRQWVESWMRHHKHVFDECSAIEKKVLNSYKTGVLGDCIWGCKSVEEKAKPETDWLSWPRYWAMTDKLEGKKKVFRATGTFDIGSWWNDRTNTWYKCGCPTVTMVEHVAKINQAYPDTFAPITKTTAETVFGADTTKL